MNNRIYPKEYFQYQIDILNKNIKKMIWIKRLKSIKVKISERSL
jgi:hypothetical protein